MRAFLFFKGCKANRILTETECGGNGTTMLVQYFDRWDVRYGHVGIERGTKERATQETHKNPQEEAYNDKRRTASY